MITSAEPADWHDLQNQVARILAECGFDVEVERSTLTVRGSVEIDVFATETFRGRLNTILCECKHWKSAVPKSVVHAFRTTASDMGANIGYIIGSSGFQSGAYDAAAMTNVKLETWASFQEEFQTQWLETFVFPSLWRRLNRFLSLAETLHPPRLYELDENGQRDFHDLWERCQPLNALAISFSPFLRGPNGTSWPTPQVPLRSSANSRHGGLDLPDEILDATGYRELIELLIKHTDAAREAFTTILRGHNHSPE